MGRNSEVHQIRELLLYLSKKRIRQFFLILVLMVLGSISEVASIGLIIPFLGALSSPETLDQNDFFAPLISFLQVNSPESLLLPLTIVFVISVIFSGIVRLLLVYVTIRFSHAVGSDLGVDVYRRTLYQRYSEHTKRNSSEIINGIIVKVNTITGGVIKPTLTLVSSVILMLGIVSILIIIDTYVAIAAFTTFGLIYLGVVKFTHKKLSQNSQNIAHHSNKMVRSLQEGLGGIRDVLIDGTQNFFCSIYKHSDLSLRKASGDNAFIAGSPRFVMEALGVALIAILAYSLRSSNDGFEHVFPILGALALGAQRLLPVMQQLYDSYSTLKGSRSSLSDVLKLLNQELPNYLNFPMSKDLDFNNKVVLKNINFNYSNDSVWALRNIDLVFQKGCKIGFIGETGSGKSTLLDVVMGLISPSSGDLIVDDVIITDENRHTWWKSIAHVPQSIYLSDNSIKDNIAFGISEENINFERVKNAAKLAQIDNIISEWPQGDLTKIGERGVRLSGGQRQRIGIARALYKGAKVLVLDEATSSLDNKTEKSVMESIESLGNDLTIFMIAHRLTTLKGCDVIYTLEKGRVIKSLTYKEILKDSNIFNETKNEK